MSTLAVLSKLADRIEERAKLNPSRWGDLQGIADDIREVIQYEMQDDE